MRNKIQFVRDDGIRAISNLKRINKSNLFIPFFSLLENTWQKLIFQIIEVSIFIIF